MKNKELLQLIKTKSQEINIKDFSKEIVEKARLLPQFESIKEPKRHFQLKPSLAYSLTLLTAVVAFFMLYNPALPVTAEIDDVNQVVALSSVTAVSLIEFTDQLIDQNDSVSLSLGYITLDAPTFFLIDQEIDDVSKYLGGVEKLLNSDDYFSYQLDSTSLNEFTNRLSFSTRDLLNQETNYALNFNKINNSIENQFIMQGSIEINGMIYSVTAHGELDHPQTIVMRVKKDTSNYIDISYTITDSLDRYHISVVENGVVSQTANLFMRQIENQKSVYIDFVDGQSKGSYAFRVSEENQVKMMNISYYIPGTSSEAGEILVTVDTSGETAQYAMSIRPQGRIPYIIERGRGSSTSNGGPGSGNPGGSNH